MAERCVAMADIIAGVDLSHESREVANILIDLAQRETMNRSAIFAATLVRELGRAGAAPEPVAVSTGPQHAPVGPMRILIIDDVVRSGETVLALVDLVRNQRADIAGIYILVTVGDDWKEYLGSIVSKYSFEVLIEL